MNNTYDILLKTAPWQKKRREVLERDGHRCRNCQAANDLHVHHRQYHIRKATGEKVMPWEYSNKYLVTLCSRCHEAGHKKYTVKSFQI